MPSLVENYILELIELSETLLGYSVKSQYSITTIH